ncbi:DNA polymerase III subunit delta [Roseomonas sp. SSH11]|uniref:DNA-directed DNA polymerase n=1 Tax=Pararoseomonas baculiformis TaxID=2820812 RepID=A0ABS4ADW2_9PROT|nr:DNA polymerase III subunit delta [Pararoseomonas baculiformis]MBP0444713.1 DNA polymerase III subunit delta [Pararoseomonas baculiformis]
MKLDARRLPAFLKDPGATRAALLFGEDAGLARERADALQEAVAPGNDPFRVAELPREAAARPGALAGEAAALALTGGRRVVRVRDATDALAPALREVLEAPGDTLIILEAGELQARSKLRQLAETHARAAAIPCYRERGAELSATIAAILKEEGVTAEAAAIAWLAGRLGDDRQTLRRELEKLALYAGRGGKLAEEDVLACIGDGSALEMDEALVAATAGDVAMADRALESAMSEGANPVQVLRALLRHVQRLHLASVAGIQALQPPVFFRSKPGFEKALRIWRPEALEAVLAGLLEAERQSKSGGTGRPVPDAAVARAALLTLARQSAILARRG